MAGIDEAITALRAEAPERDFILISRLIDRPLHQILSARLKLYKRHSACTVFLTTYGGDPHAGFRVARALQHNYSHIRVVVPSYCKSAGTLIAIAAHQLVLGDLGELGPLDLQFTKPSEVLERESGLDYMQGLNVALAHAQQAFTAFLEVRREGMRLPTNQAGELASKLACGLAAPLYSQIDPNRIGEMQRAIKIAQEYGQRLNDLPKNLLDGALTRLVAEYPSHSFVIDRKEARALFKSVEQMTAAESQMFDAVSHLLIDQGDFIYVIEEPAPQQQGVPPNEEQPIAAADVEPPRLVVAPDPPDAAAAQG
jgi:hypothetical protein